MNTKIQGNVGIGQAIAYYTSLGYIVSIPLTDSQKYDLLVDNGTKLLRIQVKTASHKAPSEAFEVQLAQKGGSRRTNIVHPFDNTSADILFILCRDNTRYIIPYTEILLVNSITLGNKYAKYRI